jgi:type I protein arginine methyltransferase
MLARQTLDVRGATVNVMVNAAPSTPAAPALGPSMGEYPVYDTLSYDELAGDDVRNQRFRAALQKLAAGRVVLDIGTGAHLLWARESLDFGARRAIAVEVIEEAFQEAAAKRDALGLAERITLLQGASTSLEIGCTADVCVAEIIGSLAGAEGAAVTLADARRRFLAPDGVIVPHRSETMAAAACLRGLLAGGPVAFEESTVKYLERLFDTNGSPFDVRLRIRNPAQSAIVSDCWPVEILDFNGDLREQQERSVRLTIEHPGRIDGILTWLRLWCLPGDEPLDALTAGSSWASIYFPLFDSEVPVEAGDTLDLTVETTIGADGLHPDYRLTGTLRTRGGDERRSGTYFSPARSLTFRQHPVYQALFPVE